MEADVDVGQRPDRRLSASVQSFRRLRNRTLADGSLELMCYQAGDPEDIVVWDLSESWAHLKTTFVPGMCARVTWMAASSS